MYLLVSANRSLVASRLRKQRRKTEDVNDTYVAKWDVARDSQH